MLEPYKLPIFMSKKAGAATHGGARPGAGRKPLRRKEILKYVTVIVRKSKERQVKQLVKDFIANDYVRDENLLKTEANEPMGQTAS